MNTEAYLSQLSSLLPTGAAWTREASSNMMAVLGFMASELAKIDARADDIMDEADPRTVFEMLPDWEAVAGLPDTCSNLGDTLQERVNALVEKITRMGGQSKNYYASVAENLGYQVEIDEFRPFICGLSRCGDVLNGGHSVRHTWRVRVLDIRATYFRTGVSRCGERLVSLRRAEDLECLLANLKPAHTKLIVAYEGV